MKTKYQVTKIQCQKQIDKLGNVCDRCGREIVPIKTTDNAGNPTYWSGCYHGEDSGHYTCGTKKETFDLAEKLVRDGEHAYHFINKGEYSKDKWNRRYWFRSQVGDFCTLLGKMEYLKRNKPRKTKKEFLEDKYF